MSGYESGIGRSGHLASSPQLLLIEEFEGSSQLDEARNEAASHDRQVIEMYQSSHKTSGSSIESEGHKIHKGVVMATR